MKKICREQYEKDFDEMFKLDKNGLMTDIDCYVSNLENKIKRQRLMINKAIDLLNAYIGILDDTSDLYLKNVKAILETEGVSK